MTNNDKYPTFELKIVSESNTDALKTIERLFPDYKFKSLIVAKGFLFNNDNVYTIKVNGMAKKTKS